MKAMILAAGRGERMRPLTDHLPKPLLTIGEDSLIIHHIKRLKKAGINELVINHAWLGQIIEEKLQDGSEWGVSIQYSAEGPKGLETAGGIANALPLLGNEIFLVINGDIYTDFDFHTVFAIKEIMEDNNRLANLWLVPNPPHNFNGDYAISNDGLLIPKNGKNYTFSGIGLYQPKLFKDLKPGNQYKLATLFNQQLINKKISASLFNGCWLDIGTVERLQQLRQQLAVN